MGKHSPLDTWLVSRSSPMLGRGRASANSRGSGGRARPLGEPCRGAPEGRTPLRGGLVALALPTPAAGPGVAARGGDGRLQDEPLPLAEALESNPPSEIRGGWEGIRVGVDRRCHSESETWEEEEGNCQGNSDDDSQIGDVYMSTSTLAVGPVEATQGGDGPHPNGPPMSTSTLAVGPVEATQGGDGPHPNGPPQDGPPPTWYFPGHEPTEALHRGPG